LGLKKETNDLSDKAQESLKVGEGAKEYVGNVSSKVADQSKQAYESAKSYFGSLKEKILPSRPPKEQVSACILRWSLDDVMVWSFNTFVSVYVSKGFFLLTAIVIWSAGATGQC